MSTVPPFSGPVMTFKADAVMEDNRCVRLASTEGYVTYCTAATHEIVGVTDGDASAADQQIAVRLFVPGQLYKIRASEAIAYNATTDERGNPLGLTTTGRVALNTTQQRFVALESIAEAGNVICMAVPNNHGNF